MNKTIYFILMVGMLAACKKSPMNTVVPAGNISIQGISLTDTLGAKVPVTKDTIVVLGIKATISQPSAVIHRVTFRADTTKLADYQAKYGNARLLPSGSFYFYQPDCSIPAHATLSDSAQVNIVKNSKLDPLTTYVLPVVIGSVDGSIGDATPGQVLYLVIRTGKEAGISKAKWKIVSASSDDGTHHATNLLDKDISTMWETNFTASMPQYVVIDFSGPTTFSGISYFSSGYTSKFAYPTKIQIELSDDGINWVDKGMFPGQTSADTQVINTGISTAGYLRFTVLSVPSYFGYTPLFLGDISLVP